MINLKIIEIEISLNEYNLLLLSLKLNFIIKSLIYKDFEEKT